MRSLADFCSFQNLQQLTQGLEIWFQFIWVYYPLWENGLNMVYLFVLLKIRSPNSFRGAGVYLDPLGFLLWNESTEIQWYKSVIVVTAKNFTFQFTKIQIKIYQYNQFFILIYIIFWNQLKLLNPVLKNPTCLNCGKWRLKLKIWKNWYQAKFYDFRT